MDTIMEVIVTMGVINNINPNTIEGVPVHFQRCQCLRRHHTTLEEEEVADSEAVVAVETVDSEGVADLEAADDSEAVVVSGGEEEIHILMKVHRTTDETFETTTITINYHRRREILVVPILFL